MVRMTNFFKKHEGARCAPCFSLTEAGGFAMVLKDFREGFPDEAETTAVNVVLYFSDEAEGPGRELLEILENDLPEIQVELFTGFDDLVTGLKRPEAEPAVVALVIADRAELEEFLPLRPILEGSKIILVLPDDTAETLSMAERLEPHFIKSTEDDFVEVATIIDEILQERRISTPEAESLPPDHNI